MGRGGYPPRWPRQLAACSPPLSDRASDGASDEASDGASAEWIGSQWGGYAVRLGVSWQHMASNWKDRPSVGRILRTSVTVTKRFCCENSGGLHSVEYQDRSGLRAGFVPEQPRVQSTARASSATCRRADGRCTAYAEASAEGKP